MARQKKIGGGKKWEKVGKKWENRVATFSSKPASKKCPVEKSALYRLPLLEKMEEKRVAIGICPAASKNC